MRESIGVGDVVVTVVGTAAILLLGTTLVLGITGASAAVTWTGTAGVVLLAVWLVASNRRRRPSRQPDAPQVVGPPAQ